MPNRLMLPPNAQQADFGRFVAALRRRFKSPREVMERLGLDQSLIQSLLRPSTKDGIVFDARRGRGRDAAAIVEAPTDLDPDERERQAGVSDRRRFGRDLEIEETSRVEKNRGASKTCASAMLSHMRIRHCLLRTMRTMRTPRSTGAKFGSGTKKLGGTATLLAAGSSVTSCAST